MRSPRRTAAALAAVASLALAACGDDSVSDLDDAPTIGEEVDIDSPAFKNSKPPEEAVKEVLDAAGGLAQKPPKELPEGFEP